jgi:hypothetical protein
VAEILAKHGHFFELLLPHVDSRSARLVIILPTALVNDRCVGR